MTADAPVPDDVVMSAAIATAGRLLLASLFLFAGVLKLTTYAQTGASMAAAGLEPVSLLLPATIALELGGGLLVAIGRRGAALAAFVLAIFTLATNYWFHDFWTMEGEVARLQGSLFLKNVAVAGGLLLLAGSQDQQRR
ncbi:DoxX family protein [Sphingomonas sp. 28-62-11]|uniref:DoxX family protein n=1 Tax=Sphingomonas sp. 28-62-11 TaxID=1970432 RepID=UPI000BD871E7|nr:MAG: hypothetical protein B7Y49_08350 [Sphingomonas sp. 28-62-11]